MVTGHLRDIDAKRVLICLLFRSAMKIPWALMLEISMRMDSPMCLLGVGTHGVGRPPLHFVTRVNFPECLSAVESKLLRALEKSRHTGLLWGIRTTMAMQIFFIMWAGWFRAKICR